MLGATNQSHNLDTSKLPLLSLHTQQPNIACQSNHFNSSDNLAAFEETTKEAVNEVHVED